METLNSEEIRKVFTFFKTIKSNELVDIVQGMLDMQKHRNILLQKIEDKDLINLFEINYRYENLLIEKIVNDKFSELKKMLKYEYDGMILFYVYCNLINKSYDISEEKRQLIINQIIRILR